MMRSIGIALSFAGLVGVMVVTALFNTATVGAMPLFRVIDVRAEYGQLVVEVQHYNDQGGHAYYELYTFQGREQYRQPLLTDMFGQDPIRRQFLRRTGEVAPIRVRDDIAEHYLPEGEAWLRHNRPILDQASILSVIHKTHERRGSGWDKGAERLTIHPMDYTAEDATGAVLLRDRFSGLKTAAHISAAEDGTLTVSTGPRAPVDPYVSTAWGTVTTVYPDASAADGQVGHVAGNLAWAVVRSAAGDAACDACTTANMRLLTNSGGSTWDDFIRAVWMFDTSSIADGDLIDSAVMEFVVTAKVNDYSDSVRIVTSTPASTTSLVAGDYAQLGTVAQANDVTIASITADSSTYNTWTLNSTGEGNVDFAGVSKFGTRFVSDATNVEPGPVANNQSRTIIATAETSLPGDKRPRLVVTHISPSAAITGTIGDGATEQEVRNGGGTVIITLSDATWVAAGATFDAQRQNIIDGLDSAQSETYGWNAEVRDKIGVGSVVRTSDTIATVTLVASEVADYRVDSAETITATVPGTALTSGSGITATPTIAITAASESMTVGGTLGASGGTAAEVKAGGETVTMTLANTEWVADGATFNAQRQDILDGMSSNRSDPNGWDIRRADFAVSDVVRTSATVVTITLSASSAYAIGQTETITAVVPAAAVVYGAAITGAPTFDISATFQLNGNRVSDAIDLSAITDVAYCAIGWQASIPANTTVAVETSLDGGATYSAATNGSCPTGITMDSSLATITDFRIKVTLNTNDNTVTPLVEELGLLVQDTSGPALYYRLNTTPGVTITDRSANNNAGTMSFPTSQTGINSTTGVLESTRSSLSLEQLLSVGDIVSPVTGAAVSGNIFNQDETGFGSLPFQSMMQTMATGGELPLKFVWISAIGLFSIALGVIALHMTGSLMISGIGLGAGLSIGAAIGGGLIPGWTVILFVILALALVVMRSRGALPL
jgi:hypothetical protein